MSDDRVISEQEQMEVELLQLESASEFVQQQYLQGMNGVIPELPEDFILIKDDYRSREL
jgi:hypothetical protein